MTGEGQQAAGPLDDPEIHRAVPSVTVIIVCFNHGRFLEQALDSVLNQSISVSQLIVADDASTDDSADRIVGWLAQNRPDATFARHRVNIGLPATLNEVVPLATGSCVVMMSADDWMYPDRIKRQSDALTAAGPTVGAVYANMTEVDEHGSPTGQRWFDHHGPPESGQLFEKMLTKAFMSAPTVMVRRTALVAALPYDESLVAEDYDMFLRLSRSIEWEYLAEPLVYYRVLGNSLSRSDDYLQTHREGHIRLLRKHLGASPECDRIIATRTTWLAKYLYYRGRSRRATVRDLLFAARIRPSTSGLATLAVAAVGFKGPFVARLSQATRARQLERRAPFGTLRR